MTVAELYPPPITDPCLRVGMRVGRDGEKYIICAPRKDMVCAIRLTDGMRWMDAINVKYIDKLTKEEAHSILGDLAAWEVLP